MILNRQLNKKKHEVLKKMLIAAAYSKMHYYDHCFLWVSGSTNTDLIFLV